MSSFCPELDKGVPLPSCCANRLEVLNAARPHTGLKVVAGLLVRASCFAIIVARNRQEAHTGACSTRDAYILPETVIQMGTFLMKAEYSDLHLRRDWLSWTRTLGAASRPHHVLVKRDILHPDHVHRLNVSYPSAKRPICTGESASSIFLRLAFGRLQDVMGDMPSRSLLLLS